MGASAPTGIRFTLWLQLRPLDFTQLTHRALPSLLGKVQGTQPPPERLVWSCSLHLPLSPPFPCLSLLPRPCLFPFFPPSLPPVLKGPHSAAKANGPIPVGLGCGFHGNSASPASVVLSPGQVAMETLTSLKSDLWDCFFLNFICFLFPEILPAQMAFSPLTADLGPSPRASPPRATKAWKTFLYKAPLVTFFHSQGE